MSKEKRDVIESIGNDFRKSNRIKYLILGFVVLISIAIVLFWPSNPEMPEGYAGAGNDTVHQTGMDAAAFFNITDTGVSPASHTIELGEAIGFRNAIDSEVTVTFDRSNDEAVIPSGGRKTLFVNGITYFQVEGKDYSAGGRVNVQ